MQSPIHEGYEYQDYFTVSIILQLMLTVKLDGLTKGTKYQLKGWQMLKEENTELLINGKRVENDYTFIEIQKEILKII